MTGTPAANRPYDIWSQVKFLDGGEALGQTFDVFKRDTDLPSHPARYAEGHTIFHESQTPRPDDTAAYGKRLTTIYQRLAGFTIRETKETAGIRLPRKTITTHTVELPPWQMAKYTAYRDELAYRYEQGRCNRNRQRRQYPKAVTPPGAVRVESRSRRRPI